MKATLIRGLNLALYLCFCVLTGTGLLLALRLRRGSQFLGWGRHDWGWLHTWVSYGFIALIAVHLLLHWGWLVRSAAQGHLWRLIAGLLAGGAIIAAFLLWPVR